MYINIMFHVIGNIFTKYDCTNLVSLLMPNVNGKNITSTIVNEVTSQHEVALHHNKLQFVIRKAIIFGICNEIKLIALRIKY